MAHPLLWAEVGGVPVCVSVRACACACAHMACWHFQTQHSADKLKSPIYMFVWQCQNVLHNISSTIAAAVLSLIYNPIRFIYIHEHTYILYWHLYGYGQEESSGLSFHPSTIHRSIQPSVHPTFHSSSPPFVCLVIYLSIHPSVPPSIHPAIHLSVYRSIHLAFHPSRSTYLCSYGNGYKIQCTRASLKWALGPGCPWCACPCALQHPQNTTR